MIGRLTGKVVAQEADGSIVLDVGGVGYEVAAPLGTLGRVRADDAGRVTLWVHTHVREDALALFGFADEAERSAFRALLGVSNVGPKIAVAVLGALPAAGARARDRAAGSRRAHVDPGVGKKIAERLLLELRDKLPIVPVVGPAIGPGAGAPLPRRRAKARSACEARSPAWGSSPPRPTGPWPRWATASTTRRCPSSSARRSRSSRSKIVAGMKDVIAYIDANRARFVDDLIEWVRIPSISSDPAHAADVATERRAPRGRAPRASAPERGRGVAHRGPSGRLRRVARRAGQAHAPRLRAPRRAARRPAGRVESRRPSSPRLRDGRLWGRGVVDDKGQVYIHAKAIESFVEDHRALPINLRMIVEGEEEVGSANLDDLLRDHAADLAADFVCVSDTAMFGRGIPSLCVGLRGLAYVEVFVDGPRIDLHSGSFGGGVANPVNALAQMIATLHDDDGPHHRAGLLRRTCSR